MRTYTYRARNMTGRIAEGTINAADENAVYQQLSEDHLVPIAIQLAAGKKTGFLEYFFSGRVKPIFDSYGDKIIGNLQIIKEIMGFNFLKVKMCWHYFSGKVFLS